MGSIQEAVRTWGAWYEADREALARVYGGAGGYHPYGPGGSFFGSEHGDHISQYRGGVVGTIARWFWGQPLRPEQRSPKLHVPVAADIASASANLLFGEQPTITAEDTKTQERLDELFDETTWEQIINAGEVCAGLGGVYIRVGWDREVSDRPMLSVFGPDVTIPTFRWNKLWEVTFVWVLHRSDDGKILRHFEHHLPGFIEHALYLGEDDNIGRRVPLTEHQDTARIVESLNDIGVIETGLSRLDVIHVQNAPNRAWRNHPIGQNLGQPDIKGTEPILDSIDEIYTSWMRDIRLAKTRVMLPQAYLESTGRGTGAMFDMDREVFVGMNALVDGGMAIELVQPTIRDEQHSRSAMGLIERAITGAGYSLQTFGLTGEVAMTATESYARERKTHQTRGSKIRRWRPALADLIEIMLAVDMIVFESTVLPVKPTIEFTPIARDNPEMLARTAQLLRVAQAASTETLVRMNHPEWRQDQVDAELIKIEAEKPEPVEPDEGADDEADGTDKDDNDG